MADCASAIHRPRRRPCARHCSACLRLRQAKRWLRADESRQRAGRASDGRVVCQLPLSRLVIITIASAFTMLSETIAVQDRTGGSQQSLKAGRLWDGISRFQGEVSMSGLCEPVQFIRETESVVPAAA